MSCNTQPIYCPLFVLCNNISYLFVCGCVHIPARAKAKVFSPAMKQVDETKKLNETETFHRKSKVKESTVYGSPVSSSSPTTLQIATSPFKGEEKLFHTYKQTKKALRGHRPPASSSFPHTCCHLQQGCVT